MTILFKSKELRTVRRSQGGTSSTRHTEIPRWSASESEAARVVSQIPKEGRVTITLKREASLWYRKPSWVSWKDFSIRVQGKSQSVRRVGTWAVTSKQDSGTVLEAVYPLVRRQQEVGGWRWPAGLPMRIIH